MALRLNLIAGVCAGAMLAIGGSAALWAQNMPPKIDDKAKATAAAKQRAEFMTAQGENEKFLVSVMKGEAPLDAKAVAAAEKIEASSKQLLTHFAPGTGDDAVQGSRARALIWSEWDKFKQLADAVPPAAAATLAAARSGDQAGFAEKEQATVSACSACHKVYRAPRQR